MAYKYNPLAEDELDYYEPTGSAVNGVPTGGTTGQVLAKKSDTNYDTEWETVSGGGLTNLDGGNVDSVYLISQVIDGGTP